MLHKIKIFTTSIKTLKEINNKLGTTNTTTAVSDEKIKGLEKTINNVQEKSNYHSKKTKLKILKILGDIKRNQ